MYNEPQVKGRNWPLAIITLAVLFFAGLAMWWMESRFGSTFAMAIVGSMVGALLVISGLLVGLANTRSTLENAADFNRSLAVTERARQGTYKEGARLERDAFNARARLEMVDTRRVDQLAQQRAKLLIDLDRERNDLERRRQELLQGAQAGDNAWAAIEDEGDFNYYK